MISPPQKLSSRVHNISGCEDIIKIRNVLKELYSDINKNADRLKNKALFCKYILRGFNMIILVFTLVCGILAIFFDNPNGNIIGYVITVLSIFCAFLKSIILLFRLETTPQKNMKIHNEYLKISRKISRLIMTRNLPITIMLRKMDKYCTFIENLKFNEFDSSVEKNDISSASSFSDDFYDNNEKKNLSKNSISIDIEDGLDKIPPS